MFARAASAGSSWTDHDRRLQQLVEKHLESDERILQVLERLDWEHLADYVDLRP